MEAACGEYGDMVPRLVVAVKGGKCQQFQRPKKFTNCDKVFVKELSQTTIGSDNDLSQSNLKEAADINNSPVVREDRHGANQKVSDGDGLTVTYSDLRDADEQGSDGEDGADSTRKPDMEQTRPIVRSKVKNSATHTGSQSGPKMVINSQNGACSVALLKNISSNQEVSVWGEGRGRGGGWTKLSHTSIHAFMNICETLVDQYM